MMLPFNRPIRRPDDFPQDARYVVLKPFTSRDQRDAEIISWSVLPLQTKEDLEKHLTEKILSGERDYLAKVLVLELPEDRNPRILEADVRVSLKP